MKSIQVLRIALAGGIFLAACNNPTKQIAGDRDRDIG